MSNASKFVFPLLVLAAVAGGAAFFFSQSGLDAPPVVDSTSPKVAQQEPKPDAPAPVRVTAQPDPIRTAASGAVGNAQTDAPQGVRGRLLLPDGTPAANVPMLLVESGMNDPIKIFLDNRSGKLRPAIANSQTAADGTFALGLRQAQKAVDLRALSPDHPEINRSQIKVRERDWYDTGDVQLEVGLVVQGRVVEATTKTPIAQATVFLSNSNQSHAMVASPGRERGVSVTTDDNGGFRFTNAPRIGLVNLSAEAQGYASTQLLNQQLKQDGPTEHTLELELGQPIAGVVVDQDGKPISGAAVIATGLSSKTPQTATVTSANDGSFEFPSLRTGPYSLLGTSSQHSDGKNAMVMTGDAAVKLVLAMRAMVKLRVLGANKVPVKNFKVGLKKYFPNNPLGIGNVPEFSDRRVNPSDYAPEHGGDWALIRGLPAGEFRFQIEDSAHAKTLSGPFTVVEGGPIAEVTAELTLGATITGTVIDDRGQPVAGATITTDLNGGLAADSGIFEIFRTMMPEKHSKAQTTSDAQGRFRIAKLAYADYMVRVSHQSYCEGTVINLKLETEGQVVDAGVIQLSLGTLVEGVTMVGGMPAGQIKVTISSPMGDALPTAEAIAAGARPARAMFNANVVSDGDGHFRILKRVPPGSYKITASRHSTNSPFDALLDMKETEKKLDILPGHDRLELTFNLAKR